MSLRIISAGAGSGKTYRLTSEMVKLLEEGVRASGIIATTFTQKAAAELQERVRVRLLEAGHSEQADQLTNALIGTVHGLGVKLLQRFAFEAGVAPNVTIIADEDQQILFNLSLATVLTPERVEKMEYLSDRLGLNKRERYDWRREVRNVTDIARANDFDNAVLEKSKALSVAHFMGLLDTSGVTQPDSWEEQLRLLLKECIARLENNEDGTKKTKSAISTLRAMLRNLELRGYLYWHEWAKLSKLGVGAKSKEDIETLIEFCTSHYAHPDFKKDIENFIHQIFAIAIAAIEEYDRYKKQRGLIDYTDMETLVNKLLDNQQVKEVLADEIDLLMVDEFQDTSPIQLEIFLKLSRLASHSVWVGDPKQSIYGFRGAAPELMQAIITKTGGIKGEDIQEHSWRSREDIVYATNALFCKAFEELPTEQIALKPKRTKAGSAPVPPEPIDLGSALHHWHFIHEGGGKRPPGKPWFENCIAFTIREMLEKGVNIVPKGDSNSRPAVAGDIAVLCRSNAECQLVAEALHRAGLKAAISRAGLLNTAESKLILACLKYLLHQYDSLSVAEIILLASGKDIEVIIEERLAFLKVKEQEGKAPLPWGHEDPFISKLNDLRSQSIELSSAEMLDLMLEELDLRRLIAAWGNTQQRLDNVEVLRKMALQYEEACNRLHTAASTGGFLLWLTEQENKGGDMQASGQQADAVNVLTYHRSKGLEWPVVICHSLEGRLRADVWGIDILSEKEEVDLNNVLANRWMRYWVNPYADQGRNTYLSNQLAESAEQKRATQMALKEEARLLYVGITRARDYLVFPSRMAPTRWLNRVWHQGEEDFPTLDADSNESPWHWEGKYLPIQSGIFTFELDFAHIEASEKEITYLEERTGKAVYLPANIDVGQENFEDEVDITIGDTLSYNKPIKLIEGVDQYELSKAVKAFLTAYFDDYAMSNKKELAADIIECYGLEGMEVDDFIRQGGQWLAFVKRQFQPLREYRKYPVQYFHQGRRFNTFIDLVLDTGHQTILIQNSGFAGTETSRQKNRALKNLGSWSYLARKAVMEILNDQPCRVFVHFVMSGQLVELEVKEFPGIQTKLPF